MPPLYLARVMFVVIRQSLVVTLTTTIQPAKCAGLYVANAIEA